ncbi:hypothetical protein LTR55_009946 [Exophiala xenobiotica]|nr:hypothetical protein LTR55_009946 [Exophiala xenobiotica]
MATGTYYIDRNVWCLGHNGPVEEPLVPEVKNIRTTHWHTQKPGESTWLGIYLENLPPPPPDFVVPGGPPSPTNLATALQILTFSDSKRIKNPSFDIEFYISEDHRAQCHKITISLDQDVLVSRSIHQRLHHNHNHHRTTAPPADLEDRVLRQPSPTDLAAALPHILTFSELKKKKKTPAPTPAPANRTPSSRVRPATTSTTTNTTNGESPSPPKEPIKKRPPPPRRRAAAEEEEEEEEGEEENDDEDDEDDEYDEDKEEQEEEEKSIRPFVDYGDDDPDDECLPSKSEERPTKRRRV